MKGWLSGCQVHQGQGHCHNHFEFRIRGQLVDRHGSPVTLDAFVFTPCDIDERMNHDGIYCPADDNQLWKNTWRGGWAKEKLIWASASTITRFDNGICGITTGDGKLLILWNDSGTIRSAPLHLPNIYGVRALGGLEDTSVWGSGVLLTNGNDEVYTVWWDGEWKEKEITIDKRFEGDGQLSVLFGSHNGEMYMLYGWYDNDVRWVCRCNLHEVYMYHMKFVGGENRYEAVRIEGDLTV